jgi:hypothetical protein
MRWYRERADRKEQKLIEETFAEAFDRPSARHIRRWKDRELHAWLASNDLQPVERSMAERELRRREAWHAPAGKAIFISMLALTVSLLSALWTALK